MLNLRPLADHVIVEAVEVEEKTASGIFLPDTAVKEKPQQGKVLAVGAGKYTDNGVLLKPFVKVGDEVIFAKYSGTPVKHEGKEYLILSERDLFAVIEK
ncbi:co-chaperone GroES [Phascolarctobacterium succinatutens]|uniref:co-chaperone GroES n=1 Tax=Phascolarctobacterium succinatutens TaxID=626940 RepID=UPI0026EF8834|nr:co-chaperone GroES [Phascolarctobacterium succinatutens]